jgi:threonine dehydrogenase-like Zn-dependent dehydrogenase
MRATVLNAVRDIELQQVDDPRIHHSTDAVVTVTATCICGSDLHPYRGHGATAFPRHIGHEFVGGCGREGIGRDRGRDR